MNKKMIAEELNRIAEELVAERKSTGVFKNDHKDLFIKFNAAYDDAVKNAPTQTDMANLKRMNSDFKKAVMAYDKGNETAFDDALSAYDELDGYNNI